MQVERFFAAIPGRLAVAVSAAWIITAGVGFAVHYGTPSESRWYAALGLGLQSVLWALCCVATKEE